MTAICGVDRRKPAPCVVLQGDESDGVDRDTGDFGSETRSGETPDTQRTYLADCRPETKKGVSFRG
jgi:hypothetical protein